MILRGESAILADKLLFATRPLTTEDLPSTPRQRFERVVVLSDLHYRTYISKEWDEAAGGWRSSIKTAHDERALEVALQFMRDWQPDAIYLNGDLLDCAQLSRFEKEPGDEEGLEADIQGLRAILSRIRREHPRAAMHYLLGNHEDRLARYLRSNAAALRWVTGLDWHVLLDSKGLNLPIYPYKERVSVLPGVFEITHGDKVAQKSGYTAHKMLELGVSGVSGHVHRLGAIYKTDRRGTTAWFEGGCLCRLDPEYAANPNWQQGMTLVYVDRVNQRFHVDLLPIINGRIVYSGQVWEVQ